MKMTYGALACEICFTPNFKFRSEKPCWADGETVQYAIGRFFSKTGSLCKKWTYESWQMRLAKNGNVKKRTTYVFPAMLLELPGVWLQVTVSANSTGLMVHRAALLRHYPQPQTDK